MRMPAAPARTVVPAVRLPDQVPAAQVPRAPAPDVLQYYSLAPAEQPERARPLRFGEAATDAAAERWAQTAQQPVRGKTSFRGMTANTFFDEAWDAANTQMYEKAWQFADVSQPVKKLLRLITAELEFMKLDEWEDGQAYLELENKISVYQREMDDLYRQNDVEKILQDLIQGSFSLIQSNPSIYEAYIIYILDTYSRALPRLSDSIREYMKYHTPSAKFLKRQGFIREQTMEEAWKEEQTLEEAWKEEQTLEEAWQGEQMMEEVWNEQTMKEAWQDGQDDYYGSSYYREHPDRVFPDFIEATVALTHMVGWEDRVKPYYLEHSDMVDMLTRSEKSLQQQLYTNPTNTLAVLVQQTYELMHDQEMYETAVLYILDHAQVPPVGLKDSVAAYMRTSTPSEGFLQRMRDYELAETMEEAWKAPASSSADDRATSQQVVALLRMLLLQPKNTVIQREVVRLLMQVATLYVPETIDLEQVRTPEISSALRMVRVVRTSKTSRL